MDKICTVGKNNIVNRLLKKSFDKFAVQVFFRGFYSLKIDNNSNVMVIELQVFTFSSSEGLQLSILSAVPCYFGFSVMVVNI